jgi:hypothetical protein
MSMADFKSGQNERLLHQNWYRISFTLINVIVLKL